MSVASCFLDSEGVYMSSIARFQKLTQVIKEDEQEITEVGRAEATQNIVSRPLLSSVVLLVWLVRC